MIAERIERLFPGIAPALERVLAVSLRELRSLSRRRTHFIHRTVFTLATAVTVMLPLHAYWRSRASFAPQEIGFVTSRVFALVVWLQSGAALLFGAMLGVASIRSEVKEQTLGLTALSRLRPFEVLFGKLLASAGILLLILASGIPVFAVLGWGGGLDYRWLGKLALLTAALALLGVASGLVAGAAMRSALGAAILALLMTSAPLIVPVLLSERFDLRDTIYPGAGYGNGGQPYHFFSPLGAVVTVASQGMASRSFRFPLGVVLALAGCYLLAGTGALPRAASRTSGPGLRHYFERLDAFFEAINPGGIVFGGAAPRPLRGNPVGWLARTTGGLGLPRYALRIGLLVFIPLLLAVSFLSMSRWDVIPFIFEAAVLAAAALTGGATIAGERDRKTLGALLSTPLPAGTILAGKTLASARLLLLVAIPLAAAYPILCELLAFGPVAGEKIRAVRLLLAGAAAFSLALLASLRAATPVKAALFGLVPVAFARLLIGVAVDLLGFRGGWRGATEAGVLTAECVFFGGAALLLYLLSVSLFDRCVGRAR